jgi:hypothetical protein
MENKNANDDAAKSPKSKHANDQPASGGVKY